jgi:hypothetical protein
MGYRFQAFSIFNNATLGAAAPATGKPDAHENLTYQSIILDGAVQLGRNYGHNRNGDLRALAPVRRIG